jgi:hypothetical protein
MLLLILAQSDDNGAFILGNYLLIRGIQNTVLTDIELISARKWQIEATNAEMRFLVALRNGESLSPESYDLIYCRLKRFTISHFLNTEDQNYASGEFQALMSGWLEFQAAKLINPVHPLFLGKPAGNPLLIYQNLTEAGLPVIETIYTTSPGKIDNPPLFLQRNHLNLEPRKPQIIEEKVKPEISWALVMGEKITGVMADDYPEQLLKLREITGLDMFKVFFQKSEQNEWGALYYTPIFDFTGIDELDMFVQYLDHKQKSSRK